MPQPYGRPAPPLLGAGLWTAAMQRDDWTCHCTGACGRAHAKSGGRCDVTARTSRVPRRAEGALLAAPASPTGDPIRDAGAEQRAWCGDCYGGAMTAYRRQAAAIQAAAIQAASVGLFELEAGAVVTTGRRTKRGAAR